MEQTLTRFRKSQILINATTRDNWVIYNSTKQNGRTVISVNTCWKVLDCSSSLLDHSSYLFHIAIIAATHVWSHWNPYQQKCTAFVRNSEWLSQSFQHTVFAEKSSWQWKPCFGTYYCITII